MGISCWSPWSLLVTLLVLVPLVSSELSKPWELGQSKLEQLKPRPIGLTKFEEPILLRGLWEVSCCCVTVSYAGRIPSCSVAFRRTTSYG
eukprot:scaffold2666_cov562-Prasinococcus_capsulatus_cf.AAC.6